MAPTGFTPLRWPISTGQPERLLYRRCLDPPGRARLLPDHDSIEERGRFREAFLGRHQAVLVFDGEHVIVAEHAQRADEFLPPLGVVAVAAGAEDPGTIALVGITLGIQHAGQ